jgi:hypothetical protein
LGAYWRKAFAAAEEEEDGGEEGEREEWEGDCKG